MYILLISILYHYMTKNAYSLVIKINI